MRDLLAEVLKCVVVVKNYQPVECESMGHIKVSLTPLLRVLQAPEKFCLQVRRPHRYTWSFIVQVRKPWKQTPTFGPLMEAYAAKPCALMLVGIIF